MCVPKHLTLNFALATYFPGTSSFLIPDQRGAKNPIAREDLQFQVFPFEFWLLCIKQDIFFLCNHVIEVPIRTFLSSREYYLGSEKEGDCSKG